MSFGSRILSMSKKSSKTVTEGERGHKKRYPYWQGQGFIIDPELSERLKEAYSLERTPNSVSDFSSLWKENLSKNLSARNFIEEVREGRRAIGETSSDRGYSMVNDTDSEKVMCGLDTLATAYLRKYGDIAAICPHCGMGMAIRIKDRRIVSHFPKGIVFWLGAGPIGAPGNPRCDHLHLFPSPKHLEAWLRSKPDELGISLSLEEAFKLGMIFDIGF